MEWTFTIFLLKGYRGPPRDNPYDVGQFPRAVFQNRVPPTFTGFVDDEVQALVDRRCVVKLADVRGPGVRRGPAWLWRCRSRRQNRD